MVKRSNRGWAGEMSWGVDAGVVRGAAVGRLAEVQGEMIKKDE